MKILKRSPRIYDDLKECKVCPMLGQDHVPSQGPIPAEVMVVGQSPGNTEVELLRPFVGPSGELLELMLEEAGLCREEVYITNILKCHPPGNRPAFANEAKNCYQIWLKREIKVVDPRLVILLGKDAHTFIIKSRNEFGHERVTPSKKRTYITLYHPSYFLRRGNPFDFIKSGKVVASLLEEQEIHED